MEIFNNLIVEMVAHWVQFLPINDMMNLRLVSKKYDDIVIYVFKTMYPAFDCATLFRLRNQNGDVDPCFATTLLQYNVLGKSNLCAFRFLCETLNYSAGIPDICGATPQGSIEMVSYLCEKDIDWGYWQRNNNMSGHPLNLAIETGNLKVVQFLYPKREELQMTCVCTSAIKKASGNDAFRVLNYLYKNMGMTTRQKKAIEIYLRQRKRRVQELGKDPEWTPAKRTKMD